MGSYAVTMSAAAFGVVDAVVSVTTDRYAAMGNASMTVAAAGHVGRVRNVKAAGVYLNAPLALSGIRITVGASISVQVASSAVMVGAGNSAAVMTAMVASYAARKTVPVAAQVWEAAARRTAPALVSRAALLAVNPTPLILRAKPSII